MAENDEESKLTRLAKECLRKHFSLYDRYEKNQWLNAEVKNGEIFITYNPHNRWPPIVNLENGVSSLTDLGLQTKIEERFAYITALTIDPNIRGKGYGTQLFLAAEEFLKKIGCKTIKVTASGEKTPKFYEKMGFVKVAEPAEFEKLI